MHSVNVLLAFVGRSLLAAALIAAGSPVAGQSSAFPNPPALAAPAAPPGPLIDTRVRLFEDDAQRMTVPVTIGAGRTLSFLIDTGAERSGVSSEVARDFQLRSVGTRTVVGFAGRQRVPTVNVPGLRYASTARPDLEALLFSRAVIGADGFLGIDALAGQRIDFDFVKQRMQVRRAPKSGMWASPEAIVVRASKRPGQLIFSNAEVDRVKADILLDTGSSLTIGNAVLLERLRRKRRLGPTIPVLMLTITGDVIKADYGILREVKVGNVLIRSLPIAFATAEPFAQLGLSDRPALLLGMDALRAFDAVTIDFRSREVRFKPRDHAKTNADVRLLGLDES